MEKKGALVGGTGGTDRRTGGPGQSCVNRRTIAGLASLLPVPRYFYHSIEWLAGYSTFLRGFREERKPEDHIDL